MRTAEQILRAIVADVEAMRTNFPPSWERVGDDSEEQHWFGEFEIACAADEEISVQWPNLGILVDEAKDVLRTGRRATV